MERTAVRALAKAMGAGLIGGVAFHVIGLPLAWMLGSLTANLILSARGVEVGVPERVRETFLGVMGLVLGSQVTPELAQRLLEWPLSAALLLAGVGASTAAAAAWYRRCGFDPVSAWFASAPGAMTAMILTGVKAGGDPQRIAIAQSLRIVLVIMILPPLFWVYEGAASNTTNEAAEHGFKALWMLLILPFLFSLGRWLRMPTPNLLAPLLFAGLLSGLEIASLQLTDWGFNIMLWVLGSAIGSRFRGISSVKLGRYLGESFIATMVALGVLSFFAELIHRCVGVPRDVALLALAPGGIGEMAMLAVALDIDPVFVAFHHLLRMVALMFMAPIWMFWLRIRCMSGPE